jgi:hypothetical protein
MGGVVVQANVWYLICNDLLAKHFDDYIDYGHYVAANLSNETIQKGEFA